MKKFSLLLILFLVVIGTIIGLRYGQLLKQEEGTISLVFAISILDFTPRDYVEFDETEYATRYVSENAGDTRYDIVKKALSDLGWSYGIREGDALFFRKDKDTIVVDTELYSEDYFLWDVPLEALDE